MTITNTTVVNTSSKAIVKSVGVGNEGNQLVVDAEIDLGGTDQSTVTLIECYYQIEGTGILTFHADALVDGNLVKSDLPLAGKGKYGLRQDQLKFGNNKQIRLTTDSNVESYLLITEFRRNK